MSNPILTSELINDDGGLEKILNSLRAIKSEFEQCEIVLHRQPLD